MGDVWHNIRMIFLWMRCGGATHDFYFSSVPQYDGDGVGVFVRSIVVSCGGFIKSGKTP